MAGVGGDDHHWPDEGEDCDGTKTTRYDCDACYPIRVTQFAQAADRRCSLQQEEVDNYLGADVEG